VRPGPDKKIEKVNIMTKISRKTKKELKHMRMIKDRNKFIHNEIKMKEVITPEDYKCRNHFEALSEKEVFDTFETEQFVEYEVGEYYAPMEIHLENDYKTFNDSGCQTDKVIIKEEKFTSPICVECRGKQMKIASLRNMVKEARISRNYAEELLRRSANPFPEWNQEDLPDDGWANKSSTEFIEKFVKPYEAIKDEKTEKLIVMFEDEIRQIIRQLLKEKYIEHKRFKVKLDDELLYVERSDEDDFFDFDDDKDHFE
jgi:hypothetical protein